MKKLLLLLLLSCQAFAQYPILTDSIKKPGIYKTVEEFKNNNPSVPLAHKIISKNNIFFTSWGKENIITYAVEMPKDDSRALDDVYGFSDGSSFYVATSPNKVHRTAFFRISQMGKYPYLDVSYGSNMDVVTVGGGFDLSKAPSIDWAVLNFETGEIRKLTVKLMKEILADKPALLERFKNQERKNDHLKVYIKEYLKN